MGATNYTTKLIDDYPAKVDAFGGHEEIANALADMIEEEKGGKSIALSGDYGSGKSTVIELLKIRLDNALKSDDAYEIFTFDAWKHQSDPLRRSFIEELHLFLKNKEWIHDEFDEDIEVLQKKREKTTNTTEPKLTFPGKVAAITTFFSPIILLIVATLIENAFNPTLNNREVFWWSFGVMFVVFWVLPMGALIVYLKNKKSDFDPFNIFVKETYTKVKNTTVRYPDPTAIEFRNLFVNIIEGALKASGRNLIIVIDNLDRMTSEKGIEVWSSLMTFLNQENLRQFESKDKIWILAPFDFAKLQEIWQDSASLNLKNFIDKTFQVVLRVAKPVMVDWKKFLRKLLEKAFPKIEDEEIHKIFRLFQIIYVQKGKNGLPTPRTLIRFVNDLSALYRRWEGEEEISLVILAFYNLISEDLKNAEDKQEQIKEYQTTNIISLLENAEWMKCTFAIHYNVDTAKAYHVVLAEPIQEALERAKTEALINLSKNQGFYEVMEDVLDAVSPSEIHVFNNILTVLGELGEPNFQSHINSWRILGNKFLDLETLGLLNEPIGQGLKNLLIYEKRRKSLSKKIIELFSKYNPENKESRGIKYWGESIFEVLDYLNGIDELRNIAERLKTPFSENEYVSLLAHLSEINSDSSLFKFLKTSNTAQALKNNFRNKVTQNELEYSHVSIFSNLITIPGFNKMNWADYIKHAAANISPKSKLDKNVFGAIVESFVQIEYSYGGDEVHKLLNNVNTFDSVLHWHYSFNKDHKSGARAVLYELLFNPNLKASNVNNSQNGKNLVVNFLNNPEENADLLQELFTVVKKINVIKPLLKIYRKQDYRVLTNLLNKTVKEGNIHKYIQPDSVVDEFDMWLKALNGENLRELIKKETQFNDLTTYIIENDAFKVGNYMLVDLCIRYAEAEEQKPKLLEYVSNKIYGIDEDEWYQILVNEPSLFELLEYLKQLNSFPKLSESFERAFDRYNNDLCNSAIHSPQKLNQMHIVVKNHFTTNSLFKTLLNVLSGTSSNDISRFLKTHEEIFLNYASKEFESKADLVLGTIFPKMLNTMIEYELRWMKKAFEKTNIYDFTSRSEKLKFNDKVRSEFFEGGHPNEILDLLESISKSAGFDIRNTKKYN